MLRRTYGRGEFPAYYVFNAQSDGFVIISCDDATDEVLGYSDEGTFDERLLPKGVYIVSNGKDRISICN